MAREQQITGNGIANQSGLEVFATTTTYNGEFMNWGDAFAYGNQLNSDPDYTTNDVEDGAVDALVNAPNTTAGQWMRYHSDSGTNLNAAVAPTSGSGYYTFNANGNAGKPSHSGMYQKLELIKGVEYQIELRPRHRDTGLRRRVSRRLAAGRHTQTVVRSGQEGHRCLVLPVGRALRERGQFLQPHQAGAGHRGARFARRPFRSGDEALPLHNGGCHEARRDLPKQSR